MAQRSYNRDSSRGEKLKMAHHFPFWVILGIASRDLSLSQPLGTIFECPP